MEETEKGPTAIRRMFGQVAPRYDLLNRLMTFGQDRRWRRRAVGMLRPAPGRRYLDVGTGTGGLPLEIHQQAPEARILALDFTPEMLRFGRSRPGAGGALWLLADALLLPFPDHSFDGVISSFLIRNVSDLETALREQLRVLVPGGKTVVLESSPPEGGLTQWFHHLHLRLVIPLLGRFVAGNAPAYRYLSATTQGFLHPEQISGVLRSVGFAHVECCRLTFGAAAIHSACKPEGAGRA
jgi:demethylmenaquinone methyltransferase/2-methoxy-6-polyprenyl-1,4-benzoquinol methylase